MTLQSYSKGTITVEQGSDTIVLAGDDAAWLQSWCVPGCQVDIAGEAQSNHMIEWIDQQTVRLALPVARADASGLAYSILMTAAAFGTNRVGALTAVERIRLMTENEVINQILAAVDAEGVTPSRSDKLFLADASDDDKVKAVTAAALQRMATGIMAKAADYEVAAGDEGKLITVSAGGAARTITLISAATVGSGFTVGIKKTDTSANTVTIAAAGGETIDGEASVALAQTFDVVWLRSDGTNWQVVGERISVAKGVRYDAFVETDAGLVDYDDKPGPTETAPGFSVLIANYDSSGRAAIVSKLSDDSGDWSDPAYLAPAIDITADPSEVVDFGTDPSASLTSDGAGGYTLSLSLPKSADMVGVTVTTLAPGEDATASLTPAEGGYTLALGLPQGATGTITGLTAFWQDIVTTKADAATSRVALKAVSYDAQTLTSAAQAQARGNIGVTKWSQHAIGQVVYVDTSLTGVEIPPSDKGFIELTDGLDGSGDYNEGKLTSETISGSGATITATAVIDDEDSPMNGETIHLINTEERVRYAGERAKAGDVFNDQGQRITGGTGNSSVALWDSASSGAIDTTSASSLSGGSSGTGILRGAILFDSADSPGARTGDRTLAKGQFAVAFLKYKDVA